MPISNKCSMKDKKHIIRVKVGSTFFGSQEMRNRKNCKFSAAVIIGYHYYKNLCVPSESKHLNCLFKENNPLAGFYSNTFVYSSFPPKIQFIVCLAQCLHIFGI